MSKHARARSRGRTRPRSRSVGRPPRALLVVSTLGLLAFGAGWVHALHEQPGAPTPQTRTDARPQTPDRAVHASQRPEARRDPRQGLPADLDEAARARIPADSRQLVLVTGKAKDSSESTVSLYTRATPGGDWTRAARWPGRNGAKGWSTERAYGDLTSPIGVFSLTDAGGRLPAPPGTRLPYDRDAAFVPSGRGVNGESLAGSFDYVVAIDYNRRQGVSPLDPAKPEGEHKGGNIWLHVDHDGPSQGCVGVPKEAMKHLLETLDPAANPVIAMGPAHL
ncbi:hypothetical protein [Streptomyces sp. RerS4]|uniref:hypothetical protein n=1 Tax=Streptomyces sp. RerS4 TaxID=2942449 RepID=UPI00201C77FE|nr:hypothetical protein [Streptomyces sp. RerS4]UQX02398.1 hypothetical protein M4D82_19325 [Streptomyces sp. RerS4]